MLAPLAKLRENPFYHTVALSQFPNIAARRSVPKPLLVNNRIIQLWQAFYMCCVFQVHSAHNSDIKFLALYPQQQATLCGMIFQQCCCSLFSKNLHKNNGDVTVSYKAIIHVNAPPKVWRWHNRFSRNKSSFQKWDTISFLFLKIVFDLFCHFIKKPQEKWFCPCCFRENSW